MFVPFLLLLISSPFTLGQKRKSCDALKYRLKDVAINGTLTQIAVQQVDNPAAPITVSGIVSVDDGCKFSLKSFTFLNGPADCFWYSNSGSCDNPAAQKLSETAVLPLSGATVNYTLTTANFREASWGPVDCVKIFCEGSRLLVAQAQIVDPDGPFAANVTNGGVGNKQSMCAVLFGLVVFSVLY